MQGAQAALALGILPQLERGSLLAQRLGVQTPFSALRDRYFVRVLSLNPVTATYLGGDAYSPELRDINTRLRDWSPAAIQAELAFYRQAKAERDAIRPASLSPEERIDWEVLGAQLGFILHQVGDLRYYQRSVDTYVAEPFRGVDWQIQQMTDAGGGLLGTPEGVGDGGEAGRVDPRLPRRREGQPAGRQGGGEPPRLAHGGARRHRRQPLERRLLPRHAGRAGAEASSAPVPSARRRWRACRTAAGRAADAWTGFARFLQQTYAGDRQDRFAVRRTREYEWRLRNNLRETRTAEQLFAYGQQQVDLYHGRVYEVAQRIAADNRLPLAFGTPGEKNASVRAVMEFLAKDSPANDDELLRWYVDAGRRAVAYGRERQLFDIPADYRLDVYPTPPVLRSTIDAAYYAAPPFKKTGVGRFYLTPTGNDPAALRENNRSSVADTAVHEGFPGHDWHYKYMTQHAAEISNIRWLTPGAVEDSSSMWEDSPAAEGWGLYAEELMSEPTADRPYGFYTPGEYMYELNGQLLRAVRIVVDVGMHTGRMSFDQAIDYFTANVNFFPNARTRAAADPAAKAVSEGALRAIYRYSKWPTQAITYNLGKSAIQSLRDAYRQAKGSAYTAKEFHERLMRMGTIPASYFREYFLASAHGG